jgi:hypothetical protein
VAQQKQCTQRFGYCPGRLPDMPRVKSHVALPLNLMSLSAMYESEMLQ